MDEQGIYQIKNLANGKVYVGSTLNFKSRKAVHFSRLKNGKHENPFLQNAFHKYGEDNFVFEVLDVTFGLDSRGLQELEQQYLDLLLPFDCSVGYNINPKAIIPPKNIDGCRLGGSRGGKKTGRANVSNGTLKHATNLALEWKKQNSEKVVEIAKAASIAAKKHWENNPKERQKQLQSAQAAAHAANSKKWIVIAPNGTEIEIENLAEFCRNNQLDTSRMAKIAKGVKGIKTCKGWRCKYA